jgi:DNA-directed RNA polymerase specialized sigma24 family protein
MTHSRESLIAALDHVPTLARVAYLLAAAEGYSHSQIAFLMGRPVEEVEGHIADALFLLSGILNRD